MPRIDSIAIDATVAAMPVGAIAAELPDHPDPSFLREAMIDQLQASEARFDFLVQPRTSNAMSVEDTQTDWTEAEAPFRKVATITIPKQVFATPERDALAENLSFNPWHALPQHRPLGGVNRIRRVVYKTISTLRRELNNVSLKEPTAWAEPTAVPEIEIKELIGSFARTAFRPFSPGVSLDDNVELSGFAKSCAISGLKKP